MPNEIDSYFTKTLIHDLSKASWCSIKERIAQVEGLIKDKKMLKDGFVYSPPTTAAISALESPKTNGLGCTFENNRERCYI